MEILGPLARVPVWAKIDLYEWDGAPPQSMDTGIEYPFPTVDDNPCLYNENVRGTLDIYDSWGAFDKQTPTYSSDPAHNGDIAVAGGYGLELSFLATIRRNYPTWNLAAIKCALGGTSLHSDWLPNTVSIGTAQAGSSNTITLASDDFGNSEAYVGRAIRINSGTGSGQERTISAFDSDTKVATVSVNWTTPPDSSSHYGIERSMMQILRTMIEQGAARLIGDGHTFEACFVWMQGESGAHGVGIVGNDGQYLSDARALFAYMRALMSDNGATNGSTMPVLIGRIGDNWGWETTPNPYLVAYGNPYAAIDASFNNDGRIPTTSENRAGALAGAVQRRATQATLGSDENCILWDNDGYPIRPPYSINEEVLDVYAYHWAPPGNLAAGERAFAAYQELTAPASTLCISTSAGVLAIGVG